MDSCDVIVVGGGHNGLTAAALLAESGRRVVLLERSDTLGGLAAGDALHSGRAAAGPLHDTTCVRPQVAEALGLAAHGLAFTDGPPPVFVPQPPDAGPGLLLHHDATRAAGEIAAHTPRDAERYHAYRASGERLAGFLRRLFDHEPPAVPDGAAGLWPLLTHGLELRRLGRADMMELLRIGPMCVADWLNEWFETELLSCALALPALAGTNAGPWSPGTTANLLRLDALAGPAVAGGAPALIDALETATRRQGVELRTGAAVRRIRTEGGAVAGVDLADGATLAASVVVCTCDPKHALLDLLAPGTLTPKTHHQIDRLRCHGTTATVDLALSAPLRFACRAELEITHARIVTTLDDMERAFDATKYGQWSEQPVLEIVAAPADPRVVTIIAHFAPHDLAGGWDDARRERLGDAVVRTLGGYAPGLESTIAARRVRTPVDLATRYGVTGGHTHHVEHALDQMIVRPAPAAARYATPVRGLYLGGSGSHPGGGLTCGPGALAAAAVRRGG